MTYSNKILMELVKHKRLNASQLAMKISHDKTKTGYIADFMVRNNKLIISEADVNGEKAYEITDVGRRQIEHLIESGPATHNHDWPAPAALPEPEPAPTETTTPSHTEKVEPDDPSAPDTTDIEPSQIMVALPKIHPEDDISYGLLNTGELILVQHGIPTLLTQHTTEAIRELLNREAHQ